MKLRVLKPIAGAIKKNWKHNLGLKVFKESVLD
jgi:hypothetical protein